MIWFWVHGGVDLRSPQAVPDAKARPIVLDSCDLGTTSTSDFLLERAFSISNLIIISQTSSPSSELTTTSPNRYLAWTRETSLCSLSGRKIACLAYIARPCIRE